MKRSLIIILLTALLFPAANAQKKKRAVAPKAKTTALTVMDKARAALEEYDFVAAEELLSKEKETLTHKKQPTAEADSMLSIAQSGLTRIHSTEHIVIIDSVVCPKEQALKTIRLSQGSGRIDTYASTYRKNDTQDATFYENDLANKRFVAVPAKSGMSPRLSVSDKIGNEWAEPTPVAGLPANDIAQNYPFLLSDGVTLYYAAKGPESIGGYDIFITRADDSNENSFLSPENLGFPFNSPANDYLLAIDEQAQLGWFVTDRRQPKGKVCIYTFIPNTRRNNYKEGTDPQVLRNAARINRIKDTWTDQSAVTAAQQRLADLRTGKTVKKAPMPDFYFPIDDNRTYTHLSDFKSDEARTKMRQWLNLDKNTKTDAGILQRLRDKYADATNESQRQQFAQSITKLESSYARNLEQVRSLAKEIRNLEITKTK